MKTYWGPPRISTTKLDGNNSSRNVYWKHRKRCHRLKSTTFAIMTTLALILSTTFIISAASSAASSAPTQPQSQLIIKQQQPSQPPNEPHTINLIPVDQPVLASDQQRNNNQNSNSRQPETSSSEIASDSFENSNFRSGESVESLAADEIQSSTEVLATSKGELEDDLSSELRQGERLYLNEGSSDTKSGRQADTLQDPSYHQMTLSQNPLDGSQSSNNNKYAQHPQQLLERRFGLFKKQHYGAPMMSANYASASPYMTDCERCMASFGSQSADIQQLEPILPPVQPLPPIQPIHIPSLPPPPPPPTTHIQTYNTGPSYSPLKNKLFMKFPFFMKGGGGSSFGEPSYSAPLHEPMTYWHSHYQPTSRPSSLSSPLYLRPASTAGAYNCIQASAPLITAPSHQEVTLAAPTKGQVKQYPHQHQQQQHHHHQQQQHHQQQTYSSSQY